MGGIKFYIQHVISQNWSKIREQSALTIGFPHSIFAVCEKLFIYFVCLYIKSQKSVDYLRKHIIGINIHKTEILYNFMRELVHIQYK